ncbi:MAG: hypothetical protein IJJ13_00870 [Lachnospiraceae bacterium]|nr:hypothetical protein [Lachnospiraceae bacterium]
MIELKCKNCNSTDIEYKGGLWVCNSCGSKFIPDKEEIPEKSMEEQLVDELCDVCDEITETDEFNEYEYGHRERLFRELDILADRIIDINPNNPYAMTAKMHVQIFNGLGDKISANRFVNYIETAVNNSDDKAKENTWDTLGEHLKRFGSKVLTQDQSLKDRLYQLVDILGDYNPEYRSYPRVEEFYEARKNNEPKEYDHSVAVLKSFDASKYPVKSGIHSYGYIENIRTKTGRYTEYDERERKNRKLLLFIVALFVIFFGIIFMGSYVVVGLLELLMGIGLMVYANWYYRKES